MNTRHRRLSIHPPVNWLTNVTTVLYHVGTPCLCTGIAAFATGCYIRRLLMASSVGLVPEILALATSLQCFRTNIQLTMMKLFSYQAQKGFLGTLRQGLWTLRTVLVMTQPQAFMVGMLSSLLSQCFVWSQDNTIKVDHVLMLCATGTLSASLTCALIGVLVMTCVICGRKYGVNYDNVAIPCVCSLTIFTSFTMTTGIATLLCYYSNARFGQVVHLGIVLVLFTVTIVCLLSSNYTPVLSDIVEMSWAPFIYTTIISSATGTLSELGALKYKLTQASVLHPIVTSVSAFATIFQSRQLSGNLDRGLTSRMRGGPSFRDPIDLLLGDDRAGNVTRTLLACVVITHTLLTAGVAVLCGWTISHWQFAAPTYLALVALQSLGNIVLVHWLTHVLWDMDYDAQIQGASYVIAANDVIVTVELGVLFIWVVPFLMRHGYTLLLTVRDELTR